MDIQKNIVSSEEPDLPADQEAETREVPDGLLVVGIVQGLTEFLPVSSSGHLIFLPALIGASRDPEARAQDLGGG